MPILKIITQPNPILRKKSVEISLEKITSRELRGLISSMAKTMVKANGRGLAAPQIGKNIRLVVINSEHGIFYLINPSFTKKSFARELGQEGCLSIPGVFGQVKRHKKISLTYYSHSGKKIKLTATGMMSRILQHEIDHLDGILFIDKAESE
ncbi:peptide deformylase [Patescibacteria group bacterium]|nr:peptide deformylase [Patescibacteria group bacterium]MBU1663151.1 peptide deformylase [Patescibacteria group bacterium]MBU1934083.1 peptide deformylase [Patescibacteria group bacterium]MBU2008100.1 peptide deformylase [Patescibacteria group bacterium]MBU2233405.1 peptide deformylase [Patescibacteria group bacterium]